MAPVGILLVDDDDGISFAVSSYFKTLGYEVDCAGTSDTASVLLANTHYSLLISDLNLGEESDAGLKVIDYARSLYPSMAAILLTAYRTQEVDNEARQRNVEIILNKPIPLAELREIVARLVPAPASDAPKRQRRQAGR